MTVTPIQPIPTEQLDTVTGGSAGSIARMIGGLVDQFAGTGGKATEAASRIGGLVDQFTGGGGE